MYDYRQYIVSCLSLVLCLADIDIDSAILKDCPNPDAFIPERECEFDPREIAFGFGRRCVEFTQYF